MSFWGHQCTFFSASEDSLEYWLTVRKTPSCCRCLHRLKSNTTDRQDLSNRSVVPFTGAGAAQGAAIHHDRLGVGDHTPVLSHAMPRVQVSLHILTCSNLGSIRNHHDLNNKFRGRAVDRLAASVSLSVARPRMRSVRRQCLRVVVVFEFGICRGHVGPHWWLRDENGRGTRNLGQLLKQRYPHYLEVVIKGKGGGDSIRLTHDKTRAVRK